MWTRWAPAVDRPEPVRRRVPFGQMRRYVVPVTVTAVVAGLLAVLAFGVASQGSTAAIQNQVDRGQYPAVPDANLSLPVLGSSKRATLASLKGKFVLVNVFASWCPPCQAETPLLRRAQATLAAHGGTVIGITYQDNASDDVQFMRRYHLNYPVLRDVGGQLAKALEVTGVPETFLINRRGQIEAMNPYQLTSKWVDTTLAKALGAHA